MTILAIAVFMMVIAANVLLCILGTTCFAKALKWQAVHDVAHDVGSSGLNACLACLSCIGGYYACEYGIELLNHLFAANTATEIISTFEAILTLVALGMRVALIADLSIFAVMFIATAIKQRQRCEVAFFCVLCACVFFLHSIRCTVWGIEFVNQKFQVATIVEYPQDNTISAPPIEEQSSQTVK